MNRRNPERCRESLKLLNDLHQGYCQNSFFLYRASDITICDEIQREKQRVLAECDDFTKPKR